MYVDYLSTPCIRTGKELKTAIFSGLVLTHTNNICNCLSHVNHFRCVSFQVSSYTEVTSVPDNVRGIVFAISYIRMTHNLKAAALAVFTKLVA